jgi:2-polyprenyl-6-methoxyphenol hydroxylase-like FAD-dependent oxidoreductase
MPTDADVLIVGAGPAGLALALQLGRAGRRVLLLDKAAAPRDKVCGEGIMPLGLAALAALGVPAAALPGADFDGLDFHAGGQAHTLRFGAGVAGRGVRRTTLLAALEAAALAQPTVALRREAVRAPLWEGGRIVGVRAVGRSYRAPRVVAADGVNSALARQSGTALRPLGYRLALRRHYRLAGAAGSRVRVGLLGRYDLYLTPVGPELLLATAMTDRDGFRVLRADYDGFLRGGPFGETFRGAAPASPLLGWYHPLFAPRDYAPGGMLLVGDAAGGIDPCLGLGISMALWSAQAAARALLEAPEDGPLRADGLERYRLARRRLFHHYGGFGSIFRFMVTSRPGRALLLGGMRAWPRTAERWLDSAARMRPWPWTFHR